MHTFGRKDGLKTMKRSKFPIGVQIQQNVPGVFAAVTTGAMMDCRMVAGSISSADGGGISLGFDSTRGAGGTYSRRLPPLLNTARRCRREYAQKGVREREART